jgi:TolB protein
MAVRLPPAGRSLSAVGRFALALGLVLLALPELARARERPPVIITDPSARTYRTAVQRFLPRTPAVGTASERIREAVEGGLLFSDLFSIVDPRAFLDATESPPLDGGPPLVCSNWRQIGSDALVQAEVDGSASALRVEFQVFDVSRGCLRLLRKRYRGGPADAARIGRAIADDIVGAFTGIPGVSDTEISFISTRTGAREVHVTNADGSDVRTATRNGSINAFPDWSPDGNTIVYTSYRYRNRPSLFFLTRGATSPGRVLRELDGMAPIYRGVFDPSGERLAIVMTRDGASDIYTVQRNGTNLRRLTNNRVIDISPSWSPDGRRLAFVSDRTGAPQIYVMNADGSNQRRITFDGSYNTAPSWSPDGRWIAYETRVGGQFDIWLIDPEGRTNVPLVTHPRSDESPTWSPDSRKLAFSSKRRGRADIYVVDVTGQHVRQVTEGGENTSPAWGPYRR